MPNDQAAELRRVIGPENAVLLPLSHMIASLEKEVEKLEPKVTLIEEPRVSSCRVRRREPRAFPSSAPC